MTTTPVENVAFARRYLAALGAGATGDALAQYFTPDVVQEEFPNRLVPTGARRGLAEMQDGALRGQKVLTRQTFDVVSTVAEDDRVALEVVWTAVLAVPIGAIPVGGEMRARFGVFLRFRDGRIAIQHNYDCFEAF